MTPWLLLVLGIAEAADTSTVLAGYGQVSAAASVEEPAAAFDSLIFAPIFLWREGERVLVEAELEFAASEEGLEAGLEYAAVNVDTGGPVITAGQFLSPLGQFMVRLHPTWINKLYDFPLPYRVGPLPMAHIGLQAQQVIRPGIVDRVVVVAFVDNGPGGVPGGPALGPSVVDDNLDKGIGGRLALFAVPELELAGSAYTGAYTDGGDERFVLVVADAAWARGGWLDLRGEYTSANWEGGEFKGAWGQAAWRLRQVPALDRLEPVVRVGWAEGDTPASEPGEEEAGGHAHGAAGVELGDEPLFEVCAGLNAYLRSNVVVKASFTHQVEVYAPTVHLALAAGF